MTWKYKNELEYDWCHAALNCVRNELKQMNYARWLIYAQKVDTLLETIVRFIRFSSLQLKIEFPITVMVDEPAISIASEVFPFADVRCITMQRDPVEAEYCVYCGYNTQTELFETEAQRHYALQNLTVFWQQIARPSRRSICISSGKVYSAYPYPIAAAECEFLHEPASASCLFAREAERLACESQHNYVILRPGIILGTGLIDSPVSDLLNRLASGDVSVVSAQPQYSMVYVTDFLTSLIKSAVMDRVNTAYNVCNSEATASLMQACQLYLAYNHPDQEWNVKLVSKSDCTNHALSGSKLETQGWHPTVDLQTMIILEAKALAGIKDGIWFNDGHQGKLSAIHSGLYHILCEIDRICKKNDIPYFLAGGTLLGAIRHQGFIPWDDDLDVMMLRQNYDRFLSAARQELPPEMFLQTPLDEPGDHYLISKIRLKDTVFSSEFLLNFPDLHNGIFVDIIAQDYTANSTLGQKIHLKLSQMARGLVFKKWSGGSAAEKGALYAVFDLIIRFAPISTLEHFQHWVLTMFNRKPNRQYLYDSMGINIAKGVYPAQWLSNQVYTRFEGGEFPVPKEYDSYLRYLYGDYMQLVPVTMRRIVHQVPWLDMGPYAGCTVSDNVHTQDSGFDKNREEKQ